MREQRSLQIDYCFPRGGSCLKGQINSRTFMTQGATLAPSSDVLLSTDTTVPSAVKGVVGKYPISDQIAFRKFQSNMGYLTFTAFKDPSNRVVEWARPVQQMVYNALVNTPLCDTVKTYSKVRLYVSPRNAVFFLFGAEADEDAPAYIAFQVKVGIYKSENERGMEILSYSKVNNMWRKMTTFEPANCTQQIKWKAIEAERLAKHAAVDFMVACALPARCESTLLAECIPLPPSFKRTYSSTSSPNATHATYVPDTADTADAPPVPMVKRQKSFSQPLESVQLL